MKRACLLGLLLAAAWACSDSDPPAQRGDSAVPPDAGADAVETPPPVDAGDGGAQPALCPSGAALVRYSLAPPQSTPPLGAIDLPGLHPNTIIAPAGTGLSNSMRIDLCQESDGVKLHAILLRSDAVTVATRFVLDGSITSPLEDFIDIPEGKVYQVRLPPAAAVVEGLGPAVGGDLRALRIRLLGNTGLLVAGHAGFLAVARGTVGASSVTYTSLYVLVGGLAPGDVFAGLRCPFGQMPLATTFRLDTAQFELEACTFLGGGITTGYRIHRLTVQDSNPALQEAHRRKFDFATEAEVAGALTYRWNHHNACDSFHLALGHADYAASAAPAAGCGPQVPNAPPRMLDEPPGIPLLYRIRYYGGPWRDGSVAGCNHFISCK